MVEDEGQAQRRRRKHSSEFKAQVIQHCGEAGVSVKSVAHSHGVDPSLVRHWLRDHKQRVGSGAQAAKLVPVVQRRSIEAARAFLAVEVEARQATAAAIHLELRRGPATAIVDWPVQEAVACGAWLREWLR